MVREKTQNHKLTRRLSEKKNEQAIINMVMVVTTRSKVHEEVAFQEREPLKGKEPQDW
jgi:hypothetical protein